MEIQTQNHLSLQPEQLSKGASFTRTCFNGLNALSGVGILSMPFAVSQGGWLSLCLLLLVATICWYTGLLLQKCMASNRLIKSYPDIGELAFGYKGKALVSIFMYLELYLVSVEFLILEGDNLEKLFPEFNFKLGHFRIGGKEGFVLLTALLILPTTWLRSFKILAYVSVGGVLASITLACSVLWVGVVDGVGFHGRRRDSLVNWQGLPTAVSLFTFCYCGHAVFPTLCNSMRERSQFSKVLIVCFITSSITYGSTAVLGYLMYGEDTKSQITLNLPMKKMSSRVAIYTTLINPLTKYAIILNPIATAIEDSLPFHKCSRRRLLSILIRTAIVISTVLVALLIPFFGYVMAFTGAFLGVTVSMILPCLCYLKIHKAATDVWMEMIPIVGIVLLGSFIGVVGTYTSVIKILKQL